MNRKNQPRHPPVRPFFFFSFSSLSLPARQQTIRPLLFLLPLSPSPHPTILPKDFFPCHICAEIPVGPDVCVCVCVYLMTILLLFYLKHDRRIVAQVFVGGAGAAVSREAAVSRSLYRCHPTGGRCRVAFWTKPAYTKAYTHTDTSTQTAYDARTRESSMCTTRLCVVRHSG